jgi:hypothetical protein
MSRKTIWNAVAAAAASMIMLLSAIPVQAQVYGGGPYGDIDGEYTWQINGKGWTIYSQNGYSWVYDDSGRRTYLDSYGNKLDNVTAAAAKSITEMRLTYHSTVNGVTVYENPNGQLYTVDSNGRVNAYGTTPAPVASDLVVTYVYTSADGYNVYRDINGLLWWFSAGGIPNRWYGSNAGAYWRTDVHDYVYRFAYRSPEGYYLYWDDYGRLWWFADGAAHMYSSGSGFDPSGKPAETNVDYKHTNTMWADGKSVTVYVNQYWQAPTTVSWAPAGMRLIGWDYAEGTGYARWKPGAWIKNTGQDLALYAVYG